MGKGLYVDGASKLVKEAVAENVIVLFNVKNSYREVSEETQLGNAILEPYI